MARKVSLLIIFLTVFIDLVGFGIVLPMLPLYSKEFGASGLAAGGIVAAYSLMQFIFSPIWGRLSDRVGRRPVILISTAGAAVSYCIFAVGCLEKSLALLIASRLAAGICGANLSVASAYIADISSLENRSKNMGLIGMAFGLGFILGPALGAISAGWFGVAGPGCVAAAICTLNLIFAFFVLGESRRPNSKPAEPTPNLNKIGRVLKRPQLGYLIGVFFLATFCFTCFESTFAVLFAGTKDKPGKFSFTEKIILPENAEVKWHANHGDEVRKGDSIAIIEGQKDIKSPATGRLNRSASNEAQINTTKTQAYWLMAFCGLVGAIVQGGLIGPLVKLLGEKKMIVLGIFCVGLSFAFIPYCSEAKGITYLMIILAFFAVSSGLYRAPTFGLISLNASEDEQGEIMGVTQSIGSLARIIGPPFALGLMDVRTDLPYLICAGIAMFAAIPAAKYIVMPSKVNHDGQLDDS